MDRGGTSDPYVRIMQGEEQLHKTMEKKKTVNPVWNDQSNVYIENPLIPLTFKVSNQIGFDCFLTFYSRCLTKTWLAAMISWARQSWI